MTVHKYYIKFFLFLVFICFSCFILPAQEIEPDTITSEQHQQRIENFSEQMQAEMDFTDLEIDAEYYAKHPINLNYASYEELAALQILNDIQIKNLLEHIKKNGKLLSIYELQSVNGFDNDIIAQLMPYVTVGMQPEKTPLTFKNVFRYGKNDVIMRYQRILEKQKGYQKVPDSVYNLSPNSYYLGSPDKLFLRYRFNYYNRVLWGFTAEKDAGEEFFKGTNPYGYDFYSGFVNVRNIGILKTLIVGDYNVQFGQGLTCWTGLSFGKSSDAVNIKKIARGIIPYSSVYENGYMRGAAFTLAYKNFELSGFYSNKNLDASTTVSDTTEDATLIITSLLEDGLHNTKSKADRKNNINQQAYGGHLAYKTRTLNIGITAYGLHFNAPLIKDQKPYNMFEFSGQDNFNVGINYSYIVRNLNFFGETAMSQNGGMATFNNLLVSANRNISFVLSHRYYQRNYQTLYYAAFSESSKAFNETGFYTGLEIKPHYKLLISAYADVFSFPWLKYQVNNPSDGFDFNIITTYKPTKKTIIQLRYKYETKETNTDETDIPIEYTVPYTKQNFRFHITYPVSKALTLSNRIEAVSYQENEKAKQWGYLVYQDIRYRTPDFPLATSIRFSIFDTRSYDARIYTYENDVLYAYSVPSFYDKGMRYYLMFQYKANKHFDIWLRFAQTFYNHKTVISSGLNEIQGNTQSEIKVQVRFKF